MNRHLPTRPLVAIEVHRAILNEERFKTRIRMWLAFIFAVIIAAMVGAVVRRQPFIPDVPWWVTPVSAVTVLIVCYWLGDRMFHKGYRGR